MIDHYRVSDEVEPMPFAVETFAALRERGVAIALDTGFDRSTLDAILERLGWRDTFDFTVTSDEVANGRPAPDMIHAAMKALGVEDASLVGKAGDSVSDIEEGINAGCGLVAAVHTVRTTPVLEQYPSVHGIERLSELIPLVDARAEMPV